MKFIPVSGTSALALCGLVAALVQAVGHSRIAGAVMVAANVGALVLEMLRVRARRRVQAWAEATPHAFKATPLSPRRSHLYLVRNEDDGREAVSAVGEKSS